MFQEIVGCIRKISSENWPFSGGPLNPPVSDHVLTHACMFTHIQCYLTVL